MLIENQLWAIERDRRREIERLAWLRQVAPKRAGPGPRTPRLIGRLLVRTGAWLILLGSPVAFRP